jgi:RNA polymerase primary sigma factor
MSGIPLDGHEGLLVADECHRYGAQQWSRVLDPAYQRRLGLSATYERGDEGDSGFLAPYFGAEPVFDIAFDRAIRDDVVAPFRLAFVGVPLSEEDQDLYVELTDTMAKTFGKLVNEFDLPPNPPGAFMRAVSQAAQGGPDPDLTWAARKYYSNFAKRRALLADNPAKLDLLGRLHPVVSGSKGTLVFTQTKTAAIAAAKCLAAHRHATAAIYGDLDGAERERLLEAFRQGNKTVLSAPRVLDEGIDVPDADLGIILASSSGRRQMIQRMGRVLRKAPGKQVARLVIFFAEGTNEDPAEGAHEGFIDMAWEVAQASDTFRGSSATRLIRFLGAEP